MAMMVLAMLRVPLSLKMPPPVIAELPEMVQLVTVEVPEAPLRIPPPPPLKLAVLPEIVELDMERVPRLKIPPPLPCVAVLPEMVELETFRVLPGALKKPVLPNEILPEIVELVTVRVPLLKNAPTPPLEFCAPVTVTPEMVKSAPVSMVKIRKLPPFALMVVSEEAPRPLMVSVPAELVVAMLGKADARLML